MKNKNFKNNVPDKTVTKGDLKDIEAVDVIVENKTEKQENDLLSDSVIDSPEELNDTNDELQQDSLDDELPKIVRKVHIPVKSFAIGIAISFFVVFIGSALLFILTPILSRLNLPLYGGYISRELLVEGLIKMDSINYEVDIWRYYNKNITDIIAGEKPQLKIDSVRSITSSTTDSEVPIHTNETILRNKVSSERRYEKNETPYQYNFYPPLNGRIETSFDKNLEKEIEVSVYGAMEVLAISDGTIIASYWDADKGNVVNIQHSDNLISTYSLLSQTSKKIGDKVFGGEVIGYVGYDKDKDDTSPLNKYKLNFGLWHNGNKVNPVNYIVF